MEPESPNSLQFARRPVRAGRSSPKPTVVFRTARPASGRRAMVTSLASTGRRNTFDALIVSDLFWSWEVLIHGASRIHMQYRCATGEGHGLKVTGRCPGSTPVAPHPGRGARYERIANGETFFSRYVHLSPTGAPRR